MKDLSIDIELRAGQKETDDRKVEFIISTGSIDRHDSVIPISAWDLSRYKKNPIVTYGHSAGSREPDLIIGKSDVKIENDKLIGIVEFEPADVNPLAEKVYKKIQLGTLKMASVGFIPKEYHFGVKEKGEDPDVLYFDKVELLEWSIVPVGSNPDAFKRMAEFKKTCKINCNDKEERNEFPERRLQAEIEILTKKISKLK